MSWGIFKDFLEKYLLTKKFKCFMFNIFKVDITSLSHDILQKALKIPWKILVTCYIAC